MLNKATGEVVTAKDIILAPGSVPFVPPGVQVWRPACVMVYVASRIVREHHACTGDTPPDCWSLTRVGL